MSDPINPHFLLADCSISHSCRATGTTHYCGNRVKVRRHKSNDAALDDRASSRARFVVVELLLLAQVFCGYNLSDLNLLAKKSRAIHPAASAAYDCQLLRLGSSKPAPFFESGSAKSEIPRKTIQGIFSD